MSAGDRRGSGLRRPLGLALAVLAATTATVRVEAGGSAETTLVVVNAASPLSQRIANEYLRLRHIPDTHVVRLSDVPATGELPIADFRKKVWGPIRAYLREHGLEEEIDLVAYSGDFPYAIGFGDDLRGKKLPADPHRGGTASLTAMTYFAQRVEAGDPGYLGVNHYFAEFVGPRRGAPPQAAADARLGDEEIQGLRKEADAALARKDYAGAAVRFRRLAASHPRFAAFWYGLATAEASRGNTVEALEALTFAVDQGWAQSQRTRREPAFGVLRELPAFGQLLERMETAYGPFESTHGFRHAYVWSNADLMFWKAGDALNRYYLSTLLAHTGVAGNSFPEIVEYLDRAAASDGTNPDGTVYLMENPNVRSETRQPLFQATVSELARRGRKAEILSAGHDGQNGIAPMGRDDVIGVVLGAADVDWVKSKSRLLPGAIAESLTSYGGHFDRPKQTKLTAFLRHGASGSSGAVQEPFSLQEKFPVPLLHVYYADGCSLAEAFYQSILTPYQLVVVGDPLARPFAKFAEAGLASPDTATPWSGTVRLAPWVQPADGKPVGTVELWVDGQRVASAAAGEAIPWDTRTVEDGSHDLRLVAVEHSTVETRSVFRSTVRVLNRDRRVEVEVIGSDVEYGQPIALSGRADGANRVELRRGHQVLGSASVTQGRWSMEVPSSAVGMGEVSILVRSVYPDGHAVRSDPLPLTVREPPLLPAATLEKPGGEGLLAVVEDEAGKAQERVVQRLIGALNELTQGGVKPRKVKLSGFVHVGEPGAYHLLVRSDGHVRVSVHDRVMVEGVRAARGAEQFAVVGLEAGWHPLEIELAPGGKLPVLKMVLGGAQAPVALSKESLGHRAGAISRP